MTIVRILLFVISSIGLWEIVRRIFQHVHISFVPGITIAIQSLLLFFAGLFNLLVEVSGLMYLAGFAGLAVILWKEKNLCFLKHYITPSVLFMAVMLLVMAFLLQGKLFTHYDSFSHWALVAKRMIATNRFPNHADTIIRFQEYPVGSAAFIYYVSKLTARSESMQMLAQFYMIMAGILPLFSLCKKGWPLIVALITAFTNFILVYNNNITDLLVDTLLPLVAMGGLLYVLQHCRKTAGVLELTPVVFYLIQITQIKNAGLFFVAFIAVLLLVRCSRNRNGLFRVGCVIAPFASFYLWHKHCQYAFDQSMSGRHVMNISSFLRMFGKKSSGNALDILKAMVKFVITWKEIWMIFGLLLIVLIFMLIFQKTKRRESVRILLLPVLLFMLWQIGMYGTYLFSMSETEAARLASIDRYERTIIISMLYLMMIPVIEFISDNYSGKKILAFICTGSMILLLVFRMPLVFRDYSVEERAWVERIQNEYHIPNGKRYTVLSTKKNRRYLLHLCRYVFMSDSVESVIVTTDEDMDSINTDYILVYDQKNETVKNWIQRHYPEQTEQQVVMTKKK